MLAAAYRGSEGGATGISIYDLLSGTYTHSHDVSSSEGRIVASIWTHDECFRFITMKQSPTTLITVWQLGSASIHTLTKVESFPGPGISVDPDAVLFLPTRSRFAFPNVGIWDVRDSLIQEIPMSNTVRNMSFSSDGRFFVYEDPNTGIQLWEESSPGYVLRGQLAPGIRYYSEPLLSPNGKSIAASVDCETHLWNTEDPIPALSSAPTRPTVQTPFLLDFSPDGSVAAAARRSDMVVTVTDLKSSNPRSIINTGMEIYGLWVTGNVVTVFDGKRIVPWELSAGDRVLNASATINDAVQTITLGPPAPSSRFHIAAISRHPNYIVTMGHGLGIYDISTGNHLVGATARHVGALWITPDGCEVGFLTWERRVGGWKIIKDGKSNVIRLKCLPENKRLPGGCPWESSHGYHVTDDGWILNSRKKRVMWLPHHWRMLDKLDWRWDGRFLGLLNRDLPEPIIIDLGERPSGDS